MYVSVAPTVYLTTWEYANMTGHSATRQLSKGKDKVELVDMGGCCEEAE